MGDIKFQPLGQALATVDARLIYAEAKRQHDALRSCAATSTRLTRWRVDLQTFYQNQFDTATAHLDPEQKLKLLTICFAYKTREKVLDFLDHVDPAAFSWVEHLRNVVLASGRDSMHDNGVGVPALASDGDSTRTFDAVEAEAEAALFTIPTLPIAYPKHFFLAWAAHVPRTHLTITNVLAHPAACGLGLTRLLKNEVRVRMLDRWQAAEEEEGEGLEDFFTALCVGRTSLPWYKKRRVGYGVVEIGGWVGRWKMARDAEAEEGAGATAGEASGVSPLGKRDVNRGDEGARPKKRVRWVDKSEQPKKRVRWVDESEKPNKRVRWVDEVDEGDVVGAD
jgi:hypothetical protein